MNFILLQIASQAEVPSVTSQWEFWAALVVQVIALVGIIWRSSIYLGSKLTEISGKIKTAENEIQTLHERQKKMDERVDRIENDFNHRFTEYKDFVRDLIDKVFKELSIKLDNQGACTSKKLGNIEKSLAYLKGRNKIGEHEEDENS